ncbi:hypothetical protein OPQ81_008936 [Rhizoctonia solani]|nr:hypothetical protein OPQ81_008936 [Rhizoctonia solani]
MPPSNPTHAPFETISTRDNGTSHREEDAREIAASWSKISTSHLESGNWQAALHARQNAVTIYRRLYEAQPKLYQSDLARELLELSKDLDRNGVIEEAYEASQKSVMLYKGMAMESFLGMETLDPYMHPQCQNIGNDLEIDQQITSPTRPGQSDLKPLIARCTLVLSFWGLLLLLR